MQCMAGQNKEVSSASVVRQILPLAAAAMISLGQIKSAPMNCKTLACCDHRAGVSSQTDNEASTQASMIIWSSRRVF